MAPWSSEDDDALKKLWPRFHPDEPQLLLSALGSRHSLEECRERYSQLLSHGDAGTRPRKVSFKLAKAKPILKTSCFPAKTPPPSAPAPASRLASSASLEDLSHGDAGTRPRKVSFKLAKPKPILKTSPLAAAKKTTPSAAKKTTPSAPAPTSCFPAKTTASRLASSASCALVPPAWAFPQASSSSSSAPSCVFFANGLGICKKGEDCTFDHGQEPNRHDVYLVPPSKALHRDTVHAHPQPHPNEAKKPYRGMEDDLKSTQNSRLSADSNKIQVLKRQLHILTEDVPRVKAGETEIESSIRRSKELTISYLFNDVKKFQKR